MVKHPVLATFIALKWKKVQWYFYVQSAIFFSFVIFYSTFIIYLFNRPEKYISVFEDILQNIESKPIVFPRRFTTEDPPAEVVQEHHKFLGHYHGGLLICELGFFILLMILVCLEFYQAWRLRRQYFFELENYIEWLVLVSAIVAMSFKDRAVNEPLRSFTVLREGP